MSPLLQLAFFATEQLIKHAPALFADFQKLVSKTDVTAEDLRAKREEIAADTYEKLVPNSKLGD